MSLKVSNLRLGVDTDERELPQQLARALGVHEGDIQRWRILRKSLDARDADDLSFVYSTEVALVDESYLLDRQLSRSGIQIAAFEDDRFDFPEPGASPLPHRPVIIGSGPAGIASGIR